jgi:hypothetical protein
MGDEDDEGFEVPTEFVAVTVNVYVSPVVSPETVQLSGPELHEQVWPPFPDVVESAAVTV